MNLRVIVPVIGDQFNDLIHEEASAYAGAGTVVEVVNLDSGTASIESAYDEVLVGPDILRKVEEAADEGADAVFISCFGDPAVPAARELVDIPVAGGFEPTVLTAMALADRFSIVTVLPSVLAMIRRLGDGLGISQRIASTRVIDTPVLELEDRDALTAKLLIEMRRALAEDGAHALVLGCTGMLGVARMLQETLAAEGPFVPVIDPTAAAVLALESQVRMGVHHSRRTFMSPPLKARNV